MLMENAYLAELPSNSTQKNKHAKLMDALSTLLEDAPNVRMHTSSGTTHASCPTAWSHSKDTADSVTLTISSEPMESAPTRINIATNMMISGSVFNAPPNTTLVSKIISAS